MIQGFPINNIREYVTEIILDHFQKNPDARDTSKGITKCWIIQETIETLVDKISENDVIDVLDSLIDKGIVGETKNKDGQFTYYKICK